LTRAKFRRCVPENEVARSDRRLAVTPDTPVRCPAPLHGVARELGAKRLRTRIGQLHVHEQERMDPECLYLRHCLAELLSSAEARIGPVVGIPPIGAADLPAEDFHHGDAISPRLNGETGEILESVPDPIFWGQQHH
jgi:hypothetical protein